MDLEKLFGWRQKKRRRSADQFEDFTSQIGSGTQVHGDLGGQGCYLVQGEVVGDSDIEGVVVLAAGAYWKGDLSADYVQIAGKVEGNVTAREKIDLTPTAVITGDLSSPVIVVGEGAIYEGAIHRPRKTRVTRYSERRGSDEGNLPA